MSRPTRRYGSRPGLGHRLLLAVAAALGALAISAGPAVASTSLRAAPQDAVASTPMHALTVASSPKPPVPMPSHPPWIQAPGGKPGAPVTPEQPIPAPGTVPGPGTCEGKVKTAPWGASKPFLCEIAPGKWVPVTQTEIDNPDDSAPDHWDVDHSKQDHCGMFDLPCQVRGAVTAWFGGLVSSAIGPTFTFLGATVFATPSMNAPSMDRARQVWNTSQWIANTCFVLLITTAGVLLISGTSLPHEIGVRDVLPRVVWGFLAANLSLTAIGYGIDFANGLANAFLQAGGRHIEVHQAAEVLARTMESAARSTSSFVTIIALVAVILAGCVAFTYVTRLAITVTLIAAAPVALMFHALPFTQGLAVLWWRGITGMLAIQVCQSLVFVTAVEVLLSFDPARPRNDTFFTIPTNGQDFIDLLLIIALMWVLLRIPFWVARTIWNQAQPRGLNGFLKTFVLYRAARYFVPSARGGQHRRASSQPPSSPGGGSGQPQSNSKPKRRRQQNWTAQPKQVPVPGQPPPPNNPGAGPQARPATQTRPGSTQTRPGPGQTPPPGGSAKGAQDPLPRRPYPVSFPLPQQPARPVNIRSGPRPTSTTRPARPYRPLPMPQARTRPVPPRPFPVWVEYRRNSRRS
ncbi:hypothetical protein [Actinomadura rupiterrae]|uniref:hypothetical protein n=1 Tax=Actinomadura rupiterrae TaxID=559627 RepID=UPI0020A615D0|nr:hypothetical protein [Actinomadura rupiterrae]MCP2342938.1 hypothetical protein [Actinomadura rupiterrae]